MITGEMFYGARQKLEDARIALHQAETAADAVTFRSAFNSFLSHARAVTWALQTDGSKVAGFKDWYADKQTEMGRDELMRFIRDARNEDTKRGEHRLQFPHTYVKHMPPSPPGAVNVVGADGPFLLVDAGTPRERRIPAGEFTVAVQISNPPQTHLGLDLDRTDPLTICRLALTYLENLVYEARTIFTEGEE